MTNPLLEPWDTPFGLPPFDRIEDDHWKPAAEAAIAQARAAIEAIAAKYEAAGKRIQLRNLSRDCHALLTKAGHLVVDSADDPDYALAVDYGVRTGILGGGH